ncbi:hypothetical protein NQ317_004817 [Molorchus minor]|uniref:Cyclic nucleotide-binding domain-containing protein n=1 Tax=Molorchus minor TaxID=1323400 RepID=A0ABQ9JDI8_9CUCU|nr:hypothetical protein NQ317_004817 [Molorchus minor]
MSPNQHFCTLKLTDTTGFPKLPPNASLGRRLIRKLRILAAVNPNNAKCKQFFRNKSSQVAEAKSFARSPYSFVVHPFSDCNTLIETLFFIAWLSSLITDPLRAFEPVEGLNGYYFYFDRYVMVNVQRVLVVSFFFVGYVDTKTKQIIVHPIKIAKHYLRTIHTVLQMLRGIAQHLTLPKSVQDLIVHVLRTFIILHFFCCMMYGIPDLVYMKHWPKESWLVMANIHRDSSVGLPDKYLECFLVVVCYFFGASHSKFDVNMPNEQLMLSAVALFGRLYTLFLIADLLRIFGIAKTSESNYMQQLSQLEEYMTTKKLPCHLRDKLLKYYEQKLKKHCFNEDELFATLSEHLRTEVFLFTARKLIRRVYFFRSIPKDLLSRIMAFMTLETYLPKEVVIKIGSKVDNVYFISSGTLAVIDAAGTEICHLSGFDEFGILASFSDAIQIYQVEAIEPTEMFIISKREFIRLMEGHTEVIAKINEMLNQRLSRLESLQEKIRKGGASVITDLKTGNILENLKEKPLVSK